MAAQAGRARPKRRATATGRKTPRGELAMNLEYLLVTFKENRTVLADGTPVGVTNHVLMLPPGGYDITLTAPEPPRRTFGLTCSARRSCDR